MLLPPHDMKVGDSFWVDSSSRSPLLSGSIKQQQLLQQTEMSKCRQVFFVPVLLSFCSALLCFILRPLHIDHASRSLILVWITAPLPQKYNRMTWHYQVFHQKCISPEMYFTKGTGATEAHFAVLTLPQLFYCVIELCGCDTLLCLCIRA